MTNGGTISGGIGGGGPNFGAPGGAGGTGIANSGAIATLTNRGTIGGGAGGAGPDFGGSGAAAVLNEKGATIGSLVNQAVGAIRGGNGGAGALAVGAGGAGVSNGGTIAALANSGKISGGRRGGADGGGTGGAGVSNNAGAMIESLTNHATGPLPAHAVSSRRDAPLRRRLRPRRALWSAPEALRSDRGALP